MLLGGRGRSQFAPSIKSGEKDGAMLGMGGEEDWEKDGEITEVVGQSDAQPWGLGA